MQSTWLQHARRLLAIAQTGLTYAHDPFDRERYQDLHVIATQLLADLAGAPPERVRELVVQDRGYATPKIDVRAAVFRKNTLLFVQERSDGLWTLPGGWADVGASAGDAACKEAEEESGFLVRPTKLLALYDREKHGHPPITHHAYKIFFRCEITGGAPRTGVETAAVGFFSEDDLPPLSLTRVTPAQIARMFEHHRNPDWPADFD